MVSVRELKRKLSIHLKRAAGEDVTVTSRGRPIVRLVPARAQSITEEPSAAEVRRRLAAIPGIILAKPGKPRGSKHPSRIPSRLRKK